MSYCSQAVTLIGCIAERARAHQAELWLRVCAARCLQSGSPTGSQRYPLPPALVQPEATIDILLYDPGMPAKSGPRRKMRLPLASSCRPRCASASSLRHLPGRGFAPPGHGALGWCGPSQRDLAPSAGMRERFLPECTFRGRGNRKLEFAVLAVAALHCGTDSRGLRAGRMEARREHLQQARPGSVGRRPQPGASRFSVTGALTGDTAGTISLTMPARLCSATAPRWRAACRCLPVRAAGGSAGSRVFRAALRS
jgi:hypothetical protein